MSQPKLFKFYLLNEAGNYYYYDGNDVQVTSTKTAIRDTPNGWDNMRMQVGRNLTDFGINATITAPLRFWGDGREILKSIYYKDSRVNFNAYCKCIIEKRIDNNGSNVWGYEQLGNDFVVDFANDQIEEAAEDGNYFVVGLNEDNVLERIQSNEGTDVEIAFDVDAINVELSGKELNSHYRWLASSLSAVTMATQNTQGYVIPMGLVKEETDYFRNLIITQTQGAEKWNTTGTPLDSNKFLYTDVNIVAPYTIEAEIEVVNSGSVGSLQLVLELLEKDMINNSNASTPLFTSGTITGTQTITISISGNMTFNPSLYTYFINLRFPSAGVNSVDITVNSIEFILDIKQALPTSYCNSFSYYNFAKKLIAAGTNNEASLASSCFLNFGAVLSDLPNYFYNLPSYTNITTGNAIRGLADNAIKTSIKEMKQDIYSRWMCGMDVTGTIVRFERLPYFFQKNVVIATVPVVSKLTKKTALEWLYSDIKCGYEDVNLDKLNAKYEINSTQQYSLFLKKITTALDLITKYRAGVYEIEFLRGDLIGKDTTDNDGDEKIFLLEVSNVISGGNNTLLKYSNPPNSISGVFSPYTHYNWGLSPDLFIYRHSPYFKGILSAPDDQSNSADKVSFVSAKKNDNYIRYINGYVLNGGDDIYLTSSYLPYQGDKLFLPQIYEFECETPENIINLILANKYGVIRFYDGDEYKNGFILDAEITPSSTSACKFTLLASPDNNVQ